MYSSDKVPTVASAVAIDRSPLRLAVFEIVWIFLIFYLFAGSRPPDAGESHYLVKAKHYWDPAWCAGDLFLESHDTHLGFYWAFGWLTRWFSLDATTWLLRVLLWGALAWAWRRLSWAVVPRPLFSLLSVGLMLLFAEHFHWSKEIVLRGGVEGKTVAYVCVLMSLAAIVASRWQAALLWTGAAGAFHVLVGGWTAVAMGVGWLLLGRQRPPAQALWRAAIGGLLLALPGLAPSLILLMQEQPAGTAEAHRIYVFERLAHHLVFHRFPAWYPIRHVSLVLLWAWLAWSQRHDLRLRRLAYVVAGTVAIGLAGIAIDQGFVLWANWTGQSADDFERAAAGLLRFYWFRVEDALVPMAVALLVVTALDRLGKVRPAAGQWLLIIAILAAAANVADACYWRARLGVPGAVLQQRATADTRLVSWWEQAPGEGWPHGDDQFLASARNVDLRAVSAREHYAWWQAACSWIAENTPADAKFITPRQQQTFKWNAGRAEVATRKDIPQDPASILAWKAALQELYPHNAAHRRFDLAAFSDTELVRLARRYNCQYIVVERRWGARPIGLRRVYPLVREENPLYDVYRVPGAAGQ